MAKLEEGGRTQWPELVGRAIARRACFGHGEDGRTRVLGRGDAAAVERRHGVVVGCGQWVRVGVEEWRSGG